MENTWHDAWHSIGSTKAKSLSIIPLLKIGSNHPCCAGLDSVQRYMSIDVLGWPSGLKRQTQALLPRKDIRT